MYRKYQKKICGLLLFFYLGLHTCQAATNVGQALQIELSDDHELAQKYYNQPIFFLTGQLGELTPTVADKLKLLLHELLILDDSSISLFFTAGKLWDGIIKKCANNDPIEEDLSLLVTITKEIKSTLGNKNPMIVQQLNILAHYLEEILCENFGICEQTTRSIRQIPDKSSKKTTPIKKAPKKNPSPKHKKKQSHQKKSSSPTLTRIVPGTDTAVNSAATLIGKVWDSTGSFFSGIGGNIAMVGLIAGIVGGALTWLTHTLKKPVEIERKARNREGLRLRHALRDKYNLIFEELEEETNRQLREIKEKGKNLAALAKQTEKIRLKAAEEAQAQRLLDQEKAEADAVLSKWKRKHPSSSHTEEVDAFLNQGKPPKKKASDIW